MTMEARAGLSDDFLGFIVGFAIAAERGGLGAGIVFFQAGRDLGVLALEQRVAGEIALDQEWAKIFDVELPDRLCEPELLEPINGGNALDAAAEQGARSIADRGQIDRVVWN